MGKQIQAADLFCGAGGTSAGLYAAADDLGLSVNLLAINHWSVAIKSHTYNHKFANHLCESLDNVNPRKVIPNGRLHLMVASPECTHHSIARGGKPCSDQSRASAWHVLRWAEALRVDNIIIENVKEFTTWGPLGANGRPLKSRKGETYTAFLNALASLGYTVEDRVLNAADYGDATARQRLFIMAKKGTRRRIRWPDATHTEAGAGDTNKWRAAREIIDWKLEGKSIFQRKKALRPNTLRRIAAGLEKFGGANAEPFLVMLRGGGCKGAGGARSVDRPCPTIAANGTHIGLAEPFIVAYHNGPDGERRTHSLDDPLPTQDCSNRFGLCEPFVIHTTHHGQDASRCHDVKNPLPTVTGAQRGEMALVEPFLVNMKGRSNASDINRPTPTQCSKQHLCLCEPFLAKYYGNGKNASGIRAPLPTVTTKERFGLVEPVADEYGIDIRFRMLQPHELAAAHSMQDMTFFGTKGAVVKQIGNSVPKELARALCRSALRN